MTTALQPVWMYVLLIISQLTFAQHLVTADTATLSAPIISTPGPSSGSLPISVIANGASQGFNIRHLVKNGSALNQESRHVSSGILGDVDNQRLFLACLLAGIYSHVFHIPISRVLRYF